MEDGGHENGTLPLQYSSGNERQGGGEIITRAQGRR
jgi:hypothetical protein